MKIVTAKRNIAVVVKKGAKGGKIFKEIIFFLTLSGIVGRNALGSELLKDALFIFVCFVKFIINTHVYS